MPIDKDDSNIEGHQDLEGCFYRDGHEPWDEDKDLAGDGDVGNQQCHSGDDVPTSCEQHFLFCLRYSLPLSRCCCRCCLLLRCCTCSC